MKNRKTHTPPTLLSLNTHKPNTNDHKLQTKDTHTHTHTHTLIAYTKSFKMEINHAMMMHVIIHMCLLMHR